MLGAFGPVVCGANPMRTNFVPADPADVQLDAKMSTFKLGLVIFLK